MDEVLIEVSRVERRSLASIQARMTAKQLGELWKGDEHACNYSDRVACPTGERHAG